MMKIFARFNEPDVHDKLVLSIIREKQIRQRIEELKDFKKKGYRNLAEIDQHLETKRQNEERGRRRLDNNQGRPLNLEKGQRRVRKELPTEKGERKLGYITRE